MRITTTRLFGLQEISPEEVMTRLGQPGFVMVDNTPLSSFRRHHLPGALHLDPGDYGASDLPGNKTDTIVFYCSDALCGAGPYAAKRARNMGFENVYVMTAGMAVWLRKGYPVEKQAPPRGEAL
ncbi:rhodanese-like domain-containing protein [Chitinophaga lutea]